MSMKGDTGSGNAHAAGIHEGGSLLAVAAIVGLSSTGCAKIGS